MSVEEVGGAELERVLRAFQKVRVDAEQKALAAALWLNPSTVSRYLKRLENNEDLSGVTLNERTRRAIASVLDGGQTLEELDHVVGQMRSTVDELEAALDLKRRLAEQATALAEGGPGPSPLDRAGGIVPEGREGEDLQPDGTEEDAG